MIKRALLATCLIASSHVVAVPNNTAAATTEVAPVTNTAYITDRVYAPVRADASDKAKLLHDGLVSGTEVIILEQNEKTGHTKIKTTAGLEGWVRAQYLNREPAAPVLLEQANAQLAKLQTENKALEDELIAIKQISASQIDAHQRNVDLVKQNQLLISEKEVLLADNARLKDRNQQRWFLYGGLLLALGALLCAACLALGKKRRNDGWA